jgi:hypothetical protein
MTRPIAIALAAAVSMAGVSAASANSKHRNTINQVPWVQR